MPPRRLVPPPRDAPRKPGAERVLFRTPAPGHSGLSAGREAADMRGFLASATGALA